MLVVVSCRSSIADKGRSPLDIAWEKILNKTSKSGQTLFRFLQDSDEGEFPGLQCLTASHRAILGFTSEALDQALEANLQKINDGDPDGRTPLLWAAYRGDF